jgi:hypothetical protein
MAKGVLDRNCSPGKFGRVINKQKILGLPQQPEEQIKKQNVTQLAKLFQFTSVLIFYTKSLVLQKHVTPKHTHLLPE